MLLLPPKKTKTKHKQLHTFRLKCQMIVKWKESTWKHSMLHYLRRYGVVSNWWWPSESLKSQIGDWMHDRCFIHPRRGIQFELLTKIAQICMKALDNALFRRCQLIAASGMASRLDQHLEDFPWKTDSVRSCSAPLAALIIMIMVCKKTPTKNPTTTTTKIKVQAREWLITHNCNAFTNKLFSGDGE